MSRTSCAPKISAPTSAVDRPHRPAQQGHPAGDLTIITNTRGVTFSWSGKNCFHLKGQTRMIPPTEVLEPYLKEPGDEVKIKGSYGVAFR